MASEDGDGGPEDRARRDAEGRRDHGRHRRRPGPHRRGRGRGGGDGPRARAVRHPPRRRRGAHGRPLDDRVHHGRGLDPGHGQVPHRPFRGGAGAGGAGRGLHRRERGPHPRRRGAPRATRAPSRSRSCAAAATSARRCAASARARRCCAPRARPAPETSCRRCATCARSPPPSGGSPPLGPEELMAEAKTLGAPYELVRRVAADGRLPVPNFAAGGIATPADAALCARSGAEAVFVGSGVFKSADPARRARAIVRATTHYEDAKAVADASRGLGEAMPGIDTAHMAAGDAAAGARLVRPLAVGVLALQGDYDAHARDLLRALGASVREVRRCAELDGLAGLVLPGGESTTLLKLMDGRAVVRRPPRVPCARRRALRDLRGRHPPRAPRGPRSAVARPARRRDRAQRLRPAGRLVRGRDRRRGRGRAHGRHVHPRARASGRPAPAVSVLGPPPRRAGRGPRRTRAGRDVPSRSSTGSPTALHRACFLRPGWPPDGVARGAYTVSDDRWRVDREVVHGFLTECYWARGNPARRPWSASIRHSLCFGIYHGRAGRLRARHHRPRDVRLPGRRVRRAARTAAAACRSG